MNYNSFLNKNHKPGNKNRYRLTNKKKNGRAILLSSIMSVVLIAVLFAFLIHTNTASNNEQLTISATESSDKQTTSLKLPEIDYNSEVTSKAMVYSVPETTLIVESPKTVQQIQKTHPSEINKISSNVIHHVEQTIEVQSLNSAGTVAIKQNLVNDKANEKIPSIAPSLSDKENKNVHDESPRIKTVVVQKGDTLSAIFKRLSLSSNTLYKIINSGKQAKSLTRIKPGQKFIITLDNQNKLESLHFALDKVDTLIINKKDKLFVSHIESKDVETRQQFASGTINNSLFSSGNKAGLSSSMIMKLAQIFGWDIDFVLDIRKGDSFAVLYEEQYIDENKIANGSILFAEFVNQGKVFKAIRYTDSSGHTDYYSEKGLSMRKAFLRTPVEFSRISSRFSSGRKHPVLNRIRAHKGVDYAASRGTPIKAVGDGKVIFKGNKGGYGRVIILQHGSKYTTLYAHMNSYNKKIKHGSRVKQGQTIGYIGSSGLATGPHLHYEFRVNGRHRNPLTVPLPSAAPIAKKYRTDFQSSADTLISQLKLRKQQTVALKDQETY